MPTTAEQALAWVTKQGDPLCMTFSPRHAKAAAELLAARIEYLEVAVAQSVEFATYVEQAAKGTMVERARHFMSQEFAQELAARLHPPPPAPRAEHCDILVLQPSGFELAIERGEDGRWRALGAEHHLTAIPAGSGESLPADVDFDRWLEAAYVYYISLGDPLMTDAEWDELGRRLAEIPSTWNHPLKRRFTEEGRLRLHTAFHLRAEEYPVHIREKHDD